MEKKAKPSTPRNSENAKPPRALLTIQTFHVSPELSGRTLEAVLRKFLPGNSWTKVRKLVESRRVSVDDELCLDSIRRVKEGESIQVSDRSAPKLPESDSLILRHIDEHIVVVEKPAGMNTVRHPTEREWSARRKAKSPTLEDLVHNRLQQMAKSKIRLPRLRVVHRLDKHTSGLLVFARTVTAERMLGKQFHAHSVHRRYLAVIPGFLPSQTITSFLVRDRGDGRRGSTPIKSQGKIATTHIEILKRFQGYTLLSCRLETGRTHQIRIHLAEAGHPICGEMVYNRTKEGKVIPDNSNAPRLALHAGELGFMHPVTRKFLRWEAEVPPDLQEFLDRMPK